LEDTGPVVPYLLRARGGEGALSPSCRAPQGHDQTLGDFEFIQLCFKMSTCGGRKSTTIQLATLGTVASPFLADLQRRLQVGKNPENEIFSINQKSAAVWS